MSDKLKKIYTALVDGADAGFTDKALYKYVVEQYPKATSRKSSKHRSWHSRTGISERTTSQGYYDLAIKHRLDPVTEDDSEEDDTARAPTLKKK